MLPSWDRLDLVSLHYIIGMLDRPTTGEYHLGSEEVAKLGDKKLAKV